MRFSPIFKIKCVICFKLNCNDYNINMLIAYSSQHWSYNSYFIIEKTEDQGNYRSELSSHSRSKWSCDGHRFSMTSKLILLTLFIVCQSSSSLTAKKPFTGKKERKTMQKLSNNILSMFILVPLRLSFKSQLQIHPITICENALVMKLKDISHYKKRNHLRMFTMEARLHWGVVGVDDISNYLFKK